MRVAWHDNRWGGTVCRNPIENSFCCSLDRIRVSKLPEDEVPLAGKEFATLRPAQLPPCKAESGAFMAEKAWTRLFEHPYARTSQATHGHLQPTEFAAAPYSSYAVPFWWMLKKNQKAIDESQPIPLPPDEEPPFPTPWVFGKARQDKLLELFFDRRLQAERSLAIFYCKEGHPLGETMNRLIVGIGTLTKISKILRYKTPNNDGHPLWDRLINHSIRPNGNQGFLLPYHNYLEPIGDPKEYSRRLELLQEIAVTPADEHTRDFSYAAELVKPGVTLTVLKRCLESVQKIKQHGIAGGDWKPRENWLNEQIARAWRDRGAFPGAGSVLEALGLRLGTSLCLDLQAINAISPEDNPWQVLDAILRGKKKAPEEYAADIEAVAKTWSGLTDERRDLLLLLSRFDLSPVQAKRWFEPRYRKSATLVMPTDAEILANPYRIVETDLGGGGDLPVAMSTVDQGLFPDSRIASKHPVPPPSNVASTNDERRARGALVTVLRSAEAEGDTLLNLDEALDRVEKLPLSTTIALGTDWVHGHQEFLGGVVEVLPVPASGDRPEMTALQLKRMQTIEAGLNKILIARCAATAAPVLEDWQTLLCSAIGEKADLVNPRSKKALMEQTEALKTLVSRKMSVLTGRAGTGKTSVVGALFHSSKLNTQGILLLAPTGKARVRLTKATKAEAQTIAQFLHGLSRYDGQRQRALLEPKQAQKGKPYARQKTVVIDECSMITSEDFYALLKALDLQHVQRIILVGDPNQLPPIGAGRPFADLVGMLQHGQTSSLPDLRSRSGALAELRTEVRTVQGKQSDALRLAALYASGQITVDADRILNDLELGSRLNDIEVCNWRTVDELRLALINQFRVHLGLTSKNDAVGFSRSLGFDEGGKISFGQPDGAESWQILSPVRMHPYGVNELNRWLQGVFRASELQMARERKAIKLGDEEIVHRDKVIQVKNDLRNGYDWEKKVVVEDIYLANGEVGLVAQRGQSGFLNVLFAGRPWMTFGYNKYDFTESSVSLELAYALTVHKAQGSDFEKVFVVIPQRCRNLSRELLYTALTRSRAHLVLMIEGDSLGNLSDLQDKSDTLRRNTNLFSTVVRDKPDEVPYAEHLIHRSLKGHKVRSKSELVIADALYRNSIDYEYERKYLSDEGWKTRPDFTFVDAAGNLILWEHLGLLHEEKYAVDWARKRKDYLAVGFVEGKTLFTTRDDERGGLDAREIQNVIEKIKVLIP